MSNSAVSRAAFLLGPRADDDEDADFHNPSIFAMSIRIPANRASLISSMANHAGISRNEMVNLVVQAGLEAIFSATDPESAAGIHQDADDNIENFIS